jgi:hypothetical protein
MRALCRLATDPGTSTSGKGVLRMDREQDATIRLADGADGAASAGVSPGTSAGDGPQALMGGRPSLAERQARGHRVRATVPRTAHATWTPPPDRPDPVALLESQAASRLPELLPIRYARMRTSAFAFLRGAAIVMASDLAHTPTTGIWTQLCGDCHLANFGLYASPERILVFDINDCDETLPGPWEWDVKRPAVSCHLAGRHNGFTEADCRHAALAAASSYRRYTAGYATMRELDVWYAHITTADLLPLVTTKRTRKRARKGVAKTRQHDSLRALARLTEVVDGRRVIANDPPLVMRITAADEQKGLTGLFAQYRQSVRGSVGRLLERFHSVDFAQKVVGVGECRHPLLPPAADRS